MEYLEKVRHTVSYIREKTGKTQVGTMAVVTGSGLDAVTSDMSIHNSLSYQDIPYFPQPTVDGHQGMFLKGELEDRPVIVLQGRFHLYEGHSPHEVCLPIRVLNELGVSTLVLTNASGALNPQFDAGSLMLLTDHVNFTGHSPLIGPNEDSWGPRFPDMARVYDPDLARLMLDCAARLGIRLERGVYMQVTGPCYETPAEARAYRRLGADAVGMSTTLEATVARHMGMRVAAVSCLTNKNLPDCMGETSHELVLEAANRASSDFARLLCEFIREM